MRKRFLLVHNPTAGLKKSRLLSDVVGALERGGATVERAPSDGAPPTAGSLASVSGAFDAVIAAGGDGTIRAAAAACGPVAPIGIVPCGTGNVFANEIVLPRSADALARVLTHGPAVGINGATANGQPFFLMAGAGFDGEVVRRLDTGAKRRWGKAAYMWPVLRALKDPAKALAVTVDGIRHEAAWVVVTNARHYGGSFTITKRADLLTPGLHAVLFKSTSRIAALHQLIWLSLGRLDAHHGVEILACRRVSVETPGVAVEIDGDRLEPTPMVVEAGGPQINIIVPPAYAATRQSTTCPAIH